MIAITIVCAAEINSETAICEPDCPETPFIANRPLHLEFVLGGCRYEADFYLRKACNWWCDILLWRVRSIDPPPCNNYNPLDLVNIATAKIIHFLIYDDPNLFQDVTGGPLCKPKKPGDVNYFWRVSKASCWKWSQNPHFDPEKPIDSLNYWGVTSYCTYDVCCLEYYEVAMDNFGQIYVTRTSATSGGDCYPTAPNCFKVCND